MQVQQVSVKDESKHVRGSDGVQVYRDDTPPYTTNRKIIYVGIMDETIRHYIPIIPSKMSPKEKKLERLNKALTICVILEYRLKL